MPKRNLTLKIAKAVVDQNMLEQSRKKALRLLENPLKLGGKTIKRDELHKR
jgi:hypothetical protein